METPMEMVEEIIGLCKCGTLVWQGAVPGFQETVICPTCRQDNSIAPTWRERWRWGRAQLRKRRKLYCPGCHKKTFSRLGLLLGIPDAFRLPRERKVRQQRRMDAVR